DASFYIKGALVLDAPDGGQVWFVGNSEDITWTRTGSISTVKLEYSDNGGSTYVNSIAPSVVASLETYEWTVPDSIDTDIRVKVTDTTNATVTDASAADFTIKGILSLTAPNAGTEEWIVGSSHAITWTRTGSIANVKLEYSTDSGTSYPNEIIASTDASTGTYDWTIPDSIGTSLKVKVSDAADATVNDDSDAVFEIKGSLIVTAPNGTEEWVVDSSEDITWTKTGTISTVKLDYSKDGGTLYDNAIVGSTAGADLSYAWTIPDDICSTTRVKIVDNSDSSVYDTSDSNFKIIGSVTLTAPNGAEEWVVGDSESITWTKVGSITNVKLEYSINSGSTYPTVIVGSTPAAGLSYSWTIPNSVYTTVRVKVADAGDVTVFDVSNADFTIMPGFEVTAPNGSEVWTVDGSEDITWITTGDCS
ncbi:MAG: hypothetical protein GY849_07230, partial [Deltaproteobacteria bacterium]|nr:hypothetical protein [Deltaproteobacteria bacterium]